MIRRLKLVLIAAATATALAACNPKVPAPANGKPTSADPDPHWVIQQKPPAKVALVFVHGVTGDMIGTWTATNGSKFWDLVDQNVLLKGKTDAFVYGFPSYLFRSGSFDIQQAANRLHERLQYHQILNYSVIVFVAHSMGGLVVMRELVTHHEELDKVPVVMFYATPMEGSLIAEIGKEFSPNSALAEMTEANGNALLQQLNDEWRALPDAQRPHVRCAYENKPIGPSKIVPWASATRFCEGATPPIEGTHITIVKPDRPGADAIVYLANALNDYVLGKNLEAKLETPDFTREADEYIFNLTVPVGKQPARLVNAGGGKLRYTFAEGSDLALLLWPGDTPRYIDPYKTDNMFIATSSGGNKNEYHFVIQVDTEPDRRVTVRIPDPVALNAQKAEVAQKVGERIQAFLSDPQQLKHFQGAATDDKEVPAAIVEVARAELARQSPNLPVPAQWVLTADLLTSLNWPTLAARALQNAEKASPAVAHQPGVKYLSGIVAAQAGEKTIFATAATPTLSADQVSTWVAIQPLTTPQNATLSTTLARSLRNVPALKVFGLSLQGDVEHAKGNNEAARAAYSESAAIKPTPSVSSRLIAVEATSGTDRPDSESGKKRTGNVERAVLGRASLPQEAVNGGSDAAAMADKRTKHHRVERNESEQPPQ
jgi:hypothetical protein